MNINLEVPKADIDATAAAAEKIPRVGVITIHFVSNHGAILQSLSSARLFNATIIDHRYSAKLKHYEATGEYREHLAAFIDQDLPLSSRQFIDSGYDCTTTFKYIDDEGYDLLVIGSDEVWKTHYRAKSPRRQFVRSLLANPYRAIRDYSWAQQHPLYSPFPNVYWPQVSANCVGFAASIGSTEIREIPYRHRVRMKQTLSRFALLGVRDLRTAEFIREICPEKRQLVRVIPDPVFTFQAGEADLQAARCELKANNIDPDKPFAFANLRPKNRTRWGNDLAATGLQVAWLHDMRLTPPQWFAAIGMASLGVTDAMHPLICSLANNVPCLSVDTRPKSVELREKFGIACYETPSEVLANWPRDISERAKSHAECVREFSQEALALARRRPA